MTEREGSGRYLEHKSAGACQHMGVAPPERTVKHIAANRANVEKRVIGTPLEVACPRYPELEMPHRYLGLSVATGQLEVLTEEARVIEESRDGVLDYRKTA